MSLLVPYHLHLSSQNLDLLVVYLQLLRLEGFWSGKAGLQKFKVNGGIAPDKVNKRLNLSVFLLATKVIAHNAVEEVQVEHFILFIRSEHELSGERATHEILSHDHHLGKPLMEVDKCLLYGMNSLSVKIGLKIKDLRRQPILELKLRTRLSFEIAVVFFCDTLQHLPQLFVLNLITTSAEESLNQ